MEIKFKSFSEYVQNMIDGLRNPKCIIDMSSFGYADRKGVCFGCAATNAVMHKTGLVFDAKSIWCSAMRSKALDMDNFWLHWFELSVDSLREGNIEACLFALDHGCPDIGFGIPNIRNVTPPFTLPWLGTQTYLGDLPAYDQYVVWLKQNGY